MNPATLCELLLVMSCGLSGRHAKKLPGLAGLLAPASFFVVGLAALAGALRYSGLTVITPLHLALGPIGGVALAALGGCFVALGTPWTLWGYRAYGLLAVVGGLFLALRPDAPWRLPLNLCGLTLTLCGAVATWPRDRHGAMAAFLGAGLLVTAGLGIGTEGSLGGFARLDLFHVTMALCMLVHAHALSRIAKAKRATAP